MRSVLTTEVINWSRSSVRELDLARRLVHFACTNRVPPKHVEPGLVMLRDPRLRRHGPEATGRNWRKASATKTFACSPRTVYCTP